jgi:F-type H+-transporting ATPase subunit b
MDETLKALGQLLLSSIPAIFGLLIVWAAYRLIVYTRLQQVLAERQARTEGAIEEAKKEIASAEERTAEYERRVREARAQVYLAQEAHSRRTMEERGKALAEARKQAETMVRGARAALEKDTLAAKAALHDQADSLANAVIESVLKPAASAGGR